MTNRIMIGRSGAQFVSRITRPTKDVSSTNLADFVLHEGFNTLVPIAKGTVTLGIGASTSFSLPQIVGKHPFVVLKSAEGVLPVSPSQNFYRGSYFINVVPTTGACTLHNEYQTALTITYAVFIAP